MAIRIRPLNTRIVIRPDDPEERSKGGIIIPDNLKERPARGTVVSKGPGMLMKTGSRWPMPPIENGDKVLYSKFAGTELKVDGVLHLVLRDDDIMAVGRGEKLQPVGDRVLVRIDKAADRTGGGIIIPDSAKEKPLMGEVMAVGEGKPVEDGTLFPLDVQVGNRVHIAKYSGIEVLVEGEKYTIFREDDLLGVIETVS
jgi:chaperonin GroES